MKRLAFVAVVFTALAAPTNTGAALFFLFDRPSAAPNDRLTVRTGGTPEGFALNQRAKPLQRAIRLYLVRNDNAVGIHSRFDARLDFVGTIRPDINGHGLMSFSVPPLDAGVYTIAYWCPGCAASSRGRTFFVQEGSKFIPRYRSKALLRIATTRCPATLPNLSRPPGEPRDASWHGNGFLWTSLASDGVYAVPPDRVAADGSIFNKLLWVTTPRWQAPTVSGRRLDAAAPPMRVVRVNRGTSSFMTPVTFPTAGCWRVKARVGDLSLTYVVEVVVRT